MCGSEDISSASAGSPTERIRERVGEAPRDRVEGQLRVHRHRALALCVLLSSGVRLYPGVHLEGDTSVAAGAEIGPDCHVRDSRIGEDAVVQYSVLDGAEVGAKATVGPYARLRAGTVMGPQSKVGTFVETKQTSIGARSKVPHLSYMGDAEIGEES